MLQSELCARNGKQKISQNARVTVATMYTAIWECAKDSHLYEDVSMLDLVSLGQCEVTDLLQLGNSLFSAC